MPSPPSPPVVYSGPPLATDGTLLPLVPFNLTVSPLELRVQADRKTGLFSGDFEVGLDVSPGPTQIRSVDIMDLVKLYVTGSPEVKFISQLPYKSVSPSLFMTVSPANWDLKSTYWYDFTSVITVFNNSPEDQTVFLQTVPILINGVRQTLSSLSTNQVIVRSGSSSVVLLASSVSGEVSSTEEVIIGAVSANQLPLSSVKVLITVDPNASVPSYYRVSNPSEYTLTIGSTVNIPFSTFGGPGGEEFWESNNPQLLASYGLRFTSSGVLISDYPLPEPPASLKIMFIAMKKISLDQKIYASKVVTLTILS